MDVAVDESPTMVQRRATRNLLMCVVVASLAVLLLMQMSSALAAPTAPTAPTVEVTLVATLTGAAEVPGPGDTDGTGAAQITVDTDTNEVCYQISVEDIATPSAGHIHSGAADASGNILIGLFSDVTGAASGCVSNVPAADVATLLADPAAHYVNIHNTDFPAGAIRGQLSASAASTATVTVAHFASFADTIDGTSVTVRINGVDALTELKYNQIVTDVVLPGGTYTVEVLPTGTSTVAISGTVTISNGVDYTVAAIGDGTNQPLELIAFVDDNTPSDTATNAKIRIAHLAPFADTIAGTTVNVCTDAGEEVIPNVPYKVHTDPYLDLPAGDYDLKIVPAADDCGTAALDLPPVALAGGEVYDVFAIGDITNQPLRIATTSGLSIAAGPTDLELGVEPMGGLDTQVFLPMMSIR